MRPIALVALLCLAACAPAARETRGGGRLQRAPLDGGGTGTSPFEEGQASWYGREQHGHLTANGEHFNMYALTAAHKKLPMNTRVRVTNRQNGRSVIVRINDRGPYSHARIIDLSYAAAKTLDMIDRGVAPVLIEVLR